jgi:hypothetical protein
MKKLETPGGPRRRYVDRYGRAFPVVDLIPWRR